MQCGSVISRMQAIREKESTPNKKVGVSELFCFKYEAHYLW